MVYLEYEKLKAKYRRIQEQYDNVLTEHERLFTKTLPKAITYDRDTVQSSPNADILANYVITEEEKGIDEQLKNLKRLLKERRRLLMAKEEELRMSKNKNDRIYTLKYLDGMGVHKIANTLNYSVSQVYRIIERIEKRI
jgi:DNA-directed RNA polymerase specialized sigma subunit